MPDKRLYEGMSTEDLIIRLEAAERVCLMYGWTGWEYRTDPQKATYQTFLSWLEVVGADFCNPDHHPQLGNAHVFMLARDYDRERNIMVEGVKAARAQAKNEKRKARDK